MQQKREVEHNLKPPKSNRVNWLYSLRKIFMISFSWGVGGWGSNWAHWLILKMVASRLSHKNTASSLLCYATPWFTPESNYSHRLAIIKGVISELWLHWNTNRLANPSRWHTELFYTSPWNLASRTILHHLIFCYRAQLPLGSEAVGKNHFRNESSVNSSCC